MSDSTPGVFPSQELNRAIEAEWVSSGDYRIRPEAMQVDPAVEGTRGGQPAHVVEAAPVRQPGDGGVARAVDRPVHQPARCGLHDQQLGVLRPARRDLVREQVAFALTHEVLAKLAGDIAG